MQERGHHQPRGEDEDRRPVVDHQLPYAEGSGVWRQCAANPAGAAEEGDGARQRVAREQGVEGVEVVGGAGGVTFVGKNSIEFGSNSF